jgi:hypothetical protein
VLDPNPNTPRNIFLATLALICVAWMIPGDSELLYVLRLPLIPLLLVFGLMWMARIKPKARWEAPDLLRERFTELFDRDGLSFQAVCSVQDARCTFEIYYQNRFANRCVAKLYFIPMEGASREGPPDVPPIRADVECAGGEVGVIRHPYFIGTAWQGKIMIYDVLALVKYPDGEGELLRSREGMDVTEPTSALAEAVQAAGLLAIGLIRFRRGSSLEFRLPEGVNDCPLPDIVAEKEILWEHRELPRLSR